LNSRYQGIIVGYGVYDEAGDTFGNYKSFGLLKKYLYTDENFEFENNERPSVSRTHYAAMLMARSAVMAYKDSRGVLVKPQVLYTPHNEHDYLTDLPKSLPETLHIFPQIQAQKSYSLNSEMGVYDRANVSRKGVLDNSATIRNFIASLKKPSN
jgi:hypothetical protein